MASFLLQHFRRSTTSSSRMTTNLLTTTGYYLAITSLLYSSSSFSTQAAKSSTPPPLFQSPLITAEQVRASLSSSEGTEGRIKFVDSSWHLDKTRDAKKEFLEEHIKGAVRFDVDTISDKSSPLPHMLPTAQFFSQAVSDLGLTNQDHIVVYTTQKSFSAARCWWTFQCFGHDKVYILQGGLPAWKKAGGGVESGEAQVCPTRPPKGLIQERGNAWLLNKKGFQAKLRPELVDSSTQVLRVVEDKKKETKPLLVDARSAARFNAEVDEPRPGLARGHIPGSYNVPFDQLLVSGDWTQYKQPDEIKQVFKAAGIDLDQVPSSKQPVITTCGSGVTAAVLSFAMVLAGKDVGSVPVYDGSWAEWGAREDLPKEP